MAQINIISRPQGLCFSGNLPKLILESDNDVRITLACHTKKILDEIYTPDFDNRISIDISEFITNELSFDMPNSDVFEQQNIRKEFVIDLYDSDNTGIATIEFVALRAGVNNLPISPELFAAQNFLTWQPHLKTITASQPEWLTVFAVYSVAQSCFVYAKAHFENGTTEDIRVAELPTTVDKAVYTLDINSIIKNLTATPTGLDVAIFKTDSPAGEKLSRTQQYKIVKPLLYEKYFLFENSLGGIDTVRCTGAQKAHPEYTPEHAIMRRVERTFFIDKKNKKTQNTGWLLRDAAAWLQDFFISKSKSIIEDDMIKSIVVDECMAETSTVEDLISFEFTYRPAEASSYLRMSGDDIVSFSATWITPTCQKTDDVLPTTYSAEWTTPTCQKQEVPTYSAEWITPTCQKTQSVVPLPSIEITLGYRLQGQNTLQVRWDSTYNFSQTIDVDLGIEVNLGIQGLDIIYDTIQITGSSGSATIPTLHSRIYEVMRIEVLDFNPKVIDGRNVLIYGMD